MCGTDCIAKAQEQQKAAMARTDAIIERIGGQRDKVIPLLQSFCNFLLNCNEEFHLLHLRNQKLVLIQAIR